MCVCVCVCEGEWNCGSDWKGSGCEAKDCDELGREREMFCGKRRDWLLLLFVGEESGEGEEGDYGCLMF